MKKKKNKSLTDIMQQYHNPKKRTCAYCGKIIEDTNDTGTLCYRCYMKEYYGN